MASSFGERLRDSMAIAGMTVDAVAKRREVRVEIVGQWLKAVRANCLDAETLSLVGLDLGVSVRWLALGLGSPVPVGMKKAREELLARKRITPRAPRKHRAVTPRE